MLQDMKRYPQQEIAGRLRDAMEEAGISLADLARACGVTIQAVYDWRLTGRIGKQHLVTIARLTKKPLEYFLVGLGRAAAIILVVLAASLPPSAEASPFLHKHFSFYTFRVIRRWLERWFAMFRSEHFALR